MKRLRDRIATRYWLLAMLVCATLVVFGYHEFVEEQQTRATEPGSGSWEHTETFFYLGVPTLLVIGWFWIRSTLGPIDDVTRALEKMDAKSLRSRLPQSGQHDEVDRLAEGFNGMANRLEQAFARIREFTMRTSHELKTPLALMRGELEVALLDPNLPKQFVPAIHSQLDEISRLARIVDRLLFLLDSDERHQQQFDFELVPIHVLIDEAAEDATVLAEPSGVHVAIIHREEVSLWADRNRLRELLLNLVDNGIKYNIAGGFLRISLRKEGPWACIEIENSGEGIAPAQLDQVFETYFRDANALQAGKQGFGLGLPIVRAIARGHGGEATISSRMHDKTTVSIRLPAQARRQPL